MRHLTPSRGLRAFLIALAAIGAMSGCATGAGSFDGPDGDRRLYEARCGFCHVPFAREDFDAREWPGVVKKMGPRAGLTGHQRERVLRYLTGPTTPPAAAGATGR